MSLSHSKTLKTFQVLLALVIVSLFVAVLWLYTGQLSQTKTKIFTEFRLPFALVNSALIPMNKVVVRHNLSQKIYNSGNSGQITSQIVSQLIKEEEIKQLASSFGILANQKQINEEYYYQSGQNYFKKQAAFESSLANYGLTEDQFKNEIIKPQLNYINLKIWFNSQSSLNSQAYRLANDYLEQIKSGQDMGQIAAQHSQDDIGKNTEGDLGFVQVTDLLPELREPIENMSVGETKIVADRNGLHIFRVEGKNDNQPHLRDIYISADNFNSWLAEKLNKFKVRILLKV